MRKIKMVIQQFFCKHKYEWYVEHSPGKFFSLSGETRVHMCNKCGKENGRFIAKYEGNGFK